MGTAEQNNENAPVAFVLVTAAGLSTCLGAAMVFNKRLVKMASKRFLAGSLGIAAGVMLYVSLVEIFVKSQLAFSNAGYSEADAYMFATVSLFGGILFYKGIDIMVHRLDGSAGDHNVDINLFDLDETSDSDPTSPQATVADGSSKNGVTLALDPRGRSSVGTTEVRSSVTVAPSSMESGGIIPNNDSTCANSAQRNGSLSLPPPLSQFSHQHDVVVELNSGGGTVRPSADLHTLHLRMAGRVHQQPASPVSALTPDHAKSFVASDEVIEDPEQVGGAIIRAGSGDNAAERQGNQQQRQQPAGDERLIRMGLMTAVAIGIHNFPEGLATFVGALSDPSVGVALAVAIAIHNIPEGLCVAIPVYYATGNRWKSFGWALLSGVSEPIGAGLGWLILKDTMSELVYGILFGVVAGMMTNITIHELIPTAVRYDPTDKVTTNSIMVGMAIMALSLTLFLY